MMEVVKARKLTKQKWLNLFVADWQNQNTKKKGKWLYASRKSEPNTGESRPDAVSIVAIAHNPEPRIILTRGFRVPINGYEWSFPAGLLEKDELIADCAKRELLEETGYELEWISQTSPTIFSSAGMTDESSVVVYGICHLQDGGKQKLDDAEEIEVHALTWTEMVSALTNPLNKFSAKTWMILDMYHKLTAFTRY